MISKHQYYLRLKDMIENCEKICFTCPVWKKRGKRLWVPDPIKEVIDSTGDYKYEVCYMCRDFLTKKKFRHRPSRSSWFPGKPRCPCKVFGRDRVVKLAKEAIKSYERGKHRWQTEGKK